MDISEQRLAGLSPEQRRLIEHWLRREQPAAEVAAPADTIPRRPATGASPLSFAQQRLWFLQQLDPASPAYNIRTAVRLVGQLDVAALERSLNVIVERHEVLRTTFHAGDSQPIQRIAPSLHIPIPLIPLNDLPPTERDAQVQRLALQVTEQPFDLARGPLLRVRLLRLAASEHVLLLTLHHVVSDAWSQGIQLRELMTLYAADLTGTPSPLPALPIQYADYAAWQRLQSETLAAQLRYWKEQLGQTPHVLNLPFDRPRPAVATYRGVWNYFTLPASVLNQIKALSQQAGITLFMTLLAAFDVLLYRYTGQTDIVVGTPVAGRNRSEVEGLIGLFVNMLALRTQLDGDPPFVTVLQRVRAMALAAYAHQDVPFEKLVEELQLARDLSRNPLFQVMLVLQNTPLPALKGPGLTVLPMEMTSTTATLDLALYMRELDQELQVRVEYNTDLFDDTTIRRMIEHLNMLLASIAAEPERRISALSLLTEAEREQLLWTWNDSARPYPHDQCFCQLFEAQVARTPDAVALVFDLRDKETRRQGDKEATGCTTNDDSVFSLQPPRGYPAFSVRLTYDQLNRRANQLARLLVAHGIGPDGLVALLTLRGVDLLIAMLAAFKAGGAYVPLDPAHPVQRQRQILLQSRSSVVLCTQAFAPTLDAALADLPAASRPLIMCIDALDAQAGPDNNLPIRCGPQNLAYVIHTSGSTGAPKGAMVEQLGMLNHLYAKIADLGLTSADAVAQTASACFDISVWQFLAALLVGGQVQIFDDRIAHDPALLLDHLVQDQITILELVPSLLRMLLVESGRRAAAAAALPSMRWLIATGEALPVDLGRQWLVAYPRIPLLNAYGPTECADDVTHYPLRQPPGADVFQMPIGRPVANTRLYLLDRQLQPVPVGVAGELYVAGDGVGRGYLNRPDLTAERFVPNPWGSGFSVQGSGETDSADTRHPIRFPPLSPPSTGGRGGVLYATGDLARYRPDGMIVFLGRSDHQVKIRGFRIELEEIATVLNGHMAVYESVVLVREDVAGDVRLVAYVVPHEDDRRMTMDDGSPSEPSSIVHRPSSIVNDLRAFLNQRLPEYMLPSAFVLLDALPRRPSGKLDRLALPQPDQARPATEREFVAPGTLTEERLAEIWMQVLGVKQVGIYDNFFDLGGHSLLVAQLLFRLRDEFQIDLPLHQLFEQPTIAELALTVEELLLAEVAGLSEEAALEQIAETDARL
jgi:amino acid adenylation domain-containing protein